MSRIAIWAGVCMLGLATASSQDIRGIEDCTKTSGLDRRTSCLQSNINFLQESAGSKNAEMLRKLAAANLEISELRKSLAELRTAVEQLKVEREAKQ